MNRFVLAALLVAGMTAPLLAADHLQQSKKLMLKSSPSGKQKFEWLTRMPSPPLPTDNPATVGATVEIRNTSTGTSDVFTMPLGSDWSANGANTLYKFKNKSAPMGDSEIKLALIKGGKLIKISGRSTGTILGDASPREIAVILTIGTGTDRYCGGCATSRRDDQSSFEAKDCPAPSACGSASPSGAFLD